MKKKFKLKNLILSLLMIGGVGVLSSCQTADYSGAKLPTDKCDVSVVSVPATGEKYAEVVLGIVNNTIYNITSVDLTYDLYAGALPFEQDVQANVEVFVRHGVSGYVAYRVKGLEKTEYASVTRVVIKEAKPATFMTLWNTYVAPFIIMITVASIALIFFAVEIFRGGLTKEMAKQVLKEKISSTLVIGSLVLLICLIPLMFSSWVVTLILVGGVVGTLLLCALMTLIRMAFIKK